MTPDGSGILELQTPFGGAVAGFGFVPFGLGSLLNASGSNTLVPIPHYSALDTQQKNMTKETFSISGVQEVQYAKPIVTHNIRVDNVSDAPVFGGYSMYEVLDTVNPSAITGIFLDANVGVRQNNIVIWTPDYVNRPMEQIRCRIIAQSEPTRVPNANGLFSFTFSLEEVGGSGLLQVPTFI